MPDDAAALGVSDAIRIDTEHMHADPSTKAMATPATLRGASTPYAIVAVTKARIEPTTSATTFTRSWAVTSFVGDTGVVASRRSTPFWRAALRDARSVIVATVAIAIASTTGT